MHGRATSTRSKMKSFHMKTCAKSLTKLACRRRSGKHFWKTHKRPDLFHKPPTPTFWQLALRQLWDRLGSVSRMEGICKRQWQAQGLEIPARICSSAWWWPEFCVKYMNELWGMALLWVVSTHHQKDGPLQTALHGLMMWLFQYVRWQRESLQKWLIWYPSYKTPWLSMAWNSLMVQVKQRSWSIFMGNGQRKPGKILKTLRKVLSVQSQSIKAWWKYLWYHATSTWADFLPDQVPNCKRFASGQRVQWQNSTHWGRFWKTEIWIWKKRQYLVHR